MLRAHILEVGRIKRASVGKNEKMEMLHNYITGAEFAQRVEVFSQTHIDMKSQLDQEKRAMKAIWSKREKQIERAESNLASMFGGLREITGASLPQIKSFELTALPEPAGSGNGPT